MGCPPQSNFSSLGSNPTEKYRRKYLRLHKAARAMIFENAALCDEVAHLEEKFVRVKEEHRFLLKSLSHYQSVSEGEMLTAASTSSNPPVTFSSSPTWGHVYTRLPVADRGSRRPVFPIVLGDLTVYSLGDVCVSSWPGSTQPVEGQCLGQL
uniref:Transforming growth factor beta regulator 1 n=1 Tax=Salmo trutta TaxID=8032 RepID=A0A674BXT9_SALTR